MHRKHVFSLVVLLAAAVVAGVLALSRTLDLGQSATASAGSDPAVALRLKELDRFERSLRQQLVKAKAPVAAAPKTIYRRAAAPTSQAAAASDHEDEHEDEGRDD
jgi:Flp pilus assembly protein CpaB